MTTTRGRQSVTYLHPRPRRAGTTAGTLPGPPTGSRSLRLVGAEREPLPEVVFRAELGELTLTVMRSGPVDRRVRRTPGGPLLLCRPLDGTVRLEQDGRQAALSPGALTVLEAARAYRVVVPHEARMAALAVPHHLVGLRQGDVAGLTAEPWPGAERTAALIFYLLAGVDPSAARLEPAAAGELGSAIAESVGALLLERLHDDTARDAAAPRHAMLLRIQAHARRHLSDPDLTPGELARRHNISLRYLQKLFQEQGLTPARWIRNERLERCRAELRDARLAHLTVAVIGERSGLRGPSHFGRLFREYYGISPQAFRGTSEPGAPEPGAPEPGAPEPGTEAARPASLAS
jgi:AraC-like DNA-binding protein